LSNDRNFNDFLVDFDDMIMRIVIINKINFKDFIIYYKDINYNNKVAVLNEIDFITYHIDYQYQCIIMVYFT